MAAASSLAIRRDQRRAAIDAVVVALRIDNDRHAEPPRLIDHGAYDARREHALGISRTAPRHQRAAAPLARMRDDRRLAVAARRVGRLPIGPDQMASNSVRTQSALCAWSAAPDRPRVGVDQCRRAWRTLPTTLRPASSSPIRRDKDAPRAERGDIARHVAGAADTDDVVADREHGRRRLRRDARNVAVNEIVEHDIADAEDRSARE